MSSAVGQRLLLCVGAVLLLCGVVSNGVARVAERQPDLALRMAPWDSRSLARRATLRLTSAKGTADYAAARSDAVRSLRRSLTSTDAVFVLLSVSDLEGRHDAAVRLATLSDDVSRRHLGTRLWLIENAVQQGNVAQALVNFDIALRTSPAAASILFPVLDNAFTDDALAQPIGRLIGRNPAWASRFIYHVATTGQATTPMARLLARSGKVPSYPGADLRKLLIDRLVAEGQIAAAVPLAALPARGMDQNVADPSFADARGYAPFAWELTDTVELAAQRLGAGAAGLSVQADAVASGTAARQIMSLAAGRYRLASRRDGPDLPETQAPSWSIVCTNAIHQPLTLLPLPRAGAAGTTFSVPGGCAHQWLALNLRSADSTDRRDFVLNEVRVTRSVE